MVKIENAMKTPKNKTKTKANANNEYEYRSINIYMKMLSYGKL